MSSFKNVMQEWQRLDWNILINGSISLYYNIEVLDKDIDWFVLNQYCISELDCSEWMSENDFHITIKDIFKFPDYYGENLNAFNDCMLGFDVPDKGGALIVLKRFDLFYKKLPDVAYSILDILETKSRRFLLTGRRLITFVQSTDPNITIKSVGACPVFWNGRERNDTKRGFK